MSTTAEKIAVMQAFERGETIQARNVWDDGFSPWLDVCSPSWNWCDREYRVKPNPREVWVNIYPDNCIPHTSKELAEGCCGKGGETIHFREVTD